MANVRSNRRPHELIDLTANGDADNDGPPRQRIKTEDDVLSAEKPEVLAADTAHVTASHINLSAQQQEAFDLAVKDRKNMYLTGSAGSGKSAVLKKIARALEKKVLRLDLDLTLGLKVFMTGPTGRAASEIGGCTLHRYCGWTPKDAQQVIRTLEKAAGSGYAQSRFAETDVLIIDEISMVSNHFLEKLNRVMKFARENNEAFGGVQIIACGDFCQLPPVKPFETCFSCGSSTYRRKRQRKAVFICENCHAEEEETEKWAFCSQAWQDAEFYNLLDRLRLSGRLLPTDTDLLLNHESNTDGGIELYPTRAEVKVINDREFAKLPGPVLRYKCLDYFWSSPTHPRFDHRKEKSARNTLQWLDYDQHPYEAIVELKAGMPVLLLTNLDVENGLINGAQGKIVGFEDYDEAKLPTLRAGIFHTEEQPEADPEHRHYISVRGGELAKLRHEQILEFILSPENKDKKWPVVQFLNGRKMTIFADCKMNQLGIEPPYTLEGRTQLPLMPQWAMTFHKAQGMSLEKVIVSLENKFEAGQAYVALSRARNLEGLTVKSIGRGFGESDVDKTVKDFHENTSWDIGKLPTL